ncbi:MAG: aminopeptidase P family N-terminal domain-containing protein, partial [Solirubrobacteraceae bacterium]
MTRIDAFAAALADAGLAAALVMNPPDVYYLAGTGQPCNLLVAPGHEPVLFARRYPQLARRGARVE